MNDYTVLAEAVEAFQEIIRAQVASLVADGFTDREAREIVAGVWRSTNMEKGAE